MRPVQVKASVVGLVALAVIAGGVLFTSRSGVEKPGASESASALASDGPVSQGSRSTIALEEATGEEASSSKTPSRELPDGVWIRGRVVLPAGTPSDERVELAARVLSFDDAPGYVAEMDGEGKFAVMFPKDVDSGWIEVHARYLVLQPNQEVDLEAPPEEIVLEPVLGARVRGRIVAPGRPESELRALAGTCVEISGKKDPGGRRFYPRKTCVGEDLRFEFLALPPRAGYELAVKAKDFLPFETELEVPPGRTTEIDLPLHAGVRVSGRVVDADGKPVAGAAAWRAVVPPREQHRRIEAEATSGPDGSFSMHAILPGDVAIVFEASGCLRETVDLGRLEDGDVREAVEVRMRSGLVHGRVEWPDGTPVSDGIVELSPSDSLDRQKTAYWEQSVAYSVYDEGRFSIEATHDGPFSLFARSPRSPDVDPDHPSGTIASGIAFLDGVLPSTVPVVLVLEPGQNVCGRVVDDLGNPVTSFSVHGHRIPASRPQSISSIVTDAIDNPAGAFEFAGLSRGTWAFGASVDERRSRGFVRVELPNQGAPIILVIPRGVTASGIVVDPDGLPVAGAEVKSPRDHETHCDGNGRFEFSDLPAGPVVLWADAPSFAPSELIRLNLEPAGSASDVRIVLRRGGSIECQVLDAEGNSEPGRPVSVQWRGEREIYREGDSRNESSDEEGRVLFEDLAPGHYSISKNTGDSATSRTEASAVVIAGEVTRVVIGGPKGSPIRVRARVTAAGAPVAGVEVRTWSTGMGEEEQVERRTGTDGRFDFLVDQPRDFELHLRVEEPGILLSTWRRVTGDASEELNLDLPRGRISGVARSSDDRPLDGVDLSIESEEIPEVFGTWTASAWARTASGGRFTFEHLPGGRYRLRGLRAGTSEDESGTTTEWILEENGKLEDVVIRIP